jgi:hypothetical protein
MDYEPQFWPDIYRQKLYINAALVMKSGNLPTTAEIRNKNSITLDNTFFMLLQWQDNGLWPMLACYFLFLQELY